MISRTSVREALPSLSRLFTPSRRPPGPTCTQRRPDRTALHHSVDGLVRHRRFVDDICVLTALEAVASYADVAVWLTKGLVTKRPLKIAAYVERRQRNIASFGRTAVLQLQHNHYGDL